MFYSPFNFVRIATKNQTAMIFIASGLISSIALSLILPEEKLAMALPAPAALIGAGLTQWSATKEDKG